MLFKLYQTVRTVRIWTIIVLGLLLSTLCGCAALLSSATNSFATSLEQAILENSDPDTVEQGLPAYLLLIDALLLSSPSNQSLLQTAASLYGSYVGGFIEDPKRARRLTKKALDYNLKAVCLADSKSCAIKNMPAHEFKDWVAKRKKSEIAMLYNLGVAWSGWLQARSDDLLAIVDLAKIQLLMNRVREFDDTWDDGGVYLYLGVFDTLLPKAYGGNPERGRGHFERAEALSKGRFLMIKVLFAQQYARLVYDRELHDRLLNEVLASDPNVSGKTLINLIAKNLAEKLLSNANDYF